jgi:hypothetical protein
VIGTNELGRRTEEMTASEFLLYAKGGDCGRLVMTCVCLILCSEATSSSEPSLVSFKSKSTQYAGLAISTLSCSGRKGDWHAKHRQGIRHREIEVEEAGWRHADSQGFCALMPFISNPRSQACRPRSCLRSFTPRLIIIQLRLIPGESAPELLSRLDTMMPPEMSGFE